MQMCGIAGILDSRPGQGGSPGLAELTGAMAATLAHRGPDDHGVWCDPAAGIGLGHRRLAVIDLSDAGHQPMVSADGRWVLAYNGECYNAGDLRTDLERRGVRFRGHCDTEVVVEAIAAWGLRQALDRLNAMFALAVWDRDRRVLHLVRDRLGEKPLYYGVHRGVVVFGSELRSLVRHPAFDRELDRRALALYLRLNHVPAPHTIYAQARKLPAGTLVSVQAGQAQWPEPTLWWDFAAVAQRGMVTQAAAAAGREQPLGVPGDALDVLESLLGDAVGRRMVADVGIGTFLSGGVDSSLVAALAQARSPDRVRTFTVGFAGVPHDEAAAAAAVARHLGTDHTGIELTGADALSAVPDLGRHWDEPFADPSQLPTLLLCRETKRHVTVALSGDGGDEAFGGYNRYVLGDLVVRRAGAWPVPLRRAAARALAVPSGRTWDRAEHLAGRLGGPFAVPGLSTKAHKLAGILGASSVREVYVSLISSWDDAEATVIDGPGGRWDGPSLPALGDPAQAMMAWDTPSVLPDEMLCKLDRASMAVSLEARVPLLDHRVVEAAWELPASLRIAGGTGKQALRRILDRYVPRHLVERPKTGFDPPIGAWLRGPLRPWAEDLLTESRLFAEGYLDPVPVRRRWDDHLAGRGSHDYALWAVLMFEAWLDHAGPAG
jgi:asparagine synthase (glutamine-hydrolysing)